MSDALISSDGNYIVARHYKTLVFFDTNDSTPIWSYNDHLYDIAMSSDGNYIVAMVSRAIKLFRRNDSAPILSYSIDDHFRDIAISSDGNYVVAAGQEDSTAYLFNRNSSRRLKYYNTGKQVEAVDISSNGSSIVVSASGSDFGELLLFNRTTWRNIVIIEVLDPEIVILTIILIPIALSVLLPGWYIVIKKKKIIIGKFTDKATLTNGRKQEIQQLPQVEMQKQTRNIWEIKLLPIFTWFSLSFLSLIGSMFFTYNYGAKVPQFTNFVNVFRVGIDAPKESIVMLLFGGVEGLILLIASFILLNLQKIDEATKLWGVSIGLLFLNWLIIPLIGLPGIGWVIYFFVCFGFLMTFLAFWKSKAMTKRGTSYSVRFATRCIKCRTQDDLTSYRFKKSYDMGRAYVWGSRRWRKIKTLEQSVPVCHDCLYKYKKWNHYSVISVVLLLTGFLILIFGSIALMMRNFWGNGFLSSFMSGLCIFIGGVIVFIYVRFMEINLSKYLKFRKRTNDLYVKPKGASNWVLFNEFLSNSYNSD